MDKKTAMIFGVTGQDGSYLSELLLGKGYQVIGVTRRCSVNNTERLENCLPNANFVLCEGDVTDYPSTSGAMREYMPDECYNLAAQSHVGTSFKQPCYSLDVCAGGVLNVLESIRTINPTCRFYQASTSELFGNNHSETHDGITRYQDEDTALMPTSPYAIAKLAGHNFVKMYRDAYNIHASAGILFNHESERRGEKFVTRKITKWIGDFVAWLPPESNINDCMSQLPCMDTQLVFRDKEFYIPTIGNVANSPVFPKLRLGNLDAARDWGHAEDYVRMMWMMLQADKPDDYVIATGKTHTIKEFLEEAFAVVGISNWSDYVYIDPEFCRPSDVEYLCGHAGKARKELGWEPRVNFKELVTRMVQHDIKSHA